MFSFSKKTAIVSLALLVMTQSKCLAHGAASNQRLLVHNLQAIHSADQIAIFRSRLLKLEIPKVNAFNTHTHYVQWLQTTATHAEEAAAQARATAGAHQASFGAVVPPPVISANRVLLMHLTATNFLGQNTPTIAAEEANYHEMWAQDTAAMYGYERAHEIEGALF
jgi:hypothetical protein